MVEQAEDEARMAWERFRAAAEALERVSRNAEMYKEHVKRMNDTLMRLIAKPHDVPWSVVVEAATNLRVAKHNLQRFVDMGHEADEYSAARKAWFEAMRVWIGDSEL